ncbi:beta-1,4-N-acetylgalactosaminyltransferase 3 [Anoplopoma fimbria]|uniref:beta-1,4-N-acetylgalactosaminyltransferase 3 n=1 Tax=Anoplopoma fimbria TaxID=229290 RepID=UPI0023ED5E5D|nr:beta-1,4-N-acetylgalactosaminyltransferase 3 [Anoplopoma fimbria]
MFTVFFPVRILIRNRKHLLLAAILTLGVAAVYHEMIAAKAWSSDTSMNLEDDNGNWRSAIFSRTVRKDHQPDSVEDSAVWRSSYTPQDWKPEYKGRANLHVFEDWCGSSTADLRKNLHYPLYPHSRTTVQKLAISPQWTNYGLRIFGYLHPYADGEFAFALSSDDNSELWLSTDYCPLNLQLLAWVGETGTEWTAPGEFEKYASQTSKPVWLSAQKKYFFEVIHKQNNKGTDHVEVAWQLLDQGFKFKVIESSHISLYVDESALLVSDVAHIPQTAASHQQTPTKQQTGAADMLREDPRDTLYQVPLIHSKFLQDVLPDCSYKPSYTIKNFSLYRYQGLEFVHMSYVYPNDYTRLTHIETEDSCFYPKSLQYTKRSRFARYMRLDRSNMQDIGNTGKKVKNKVKKVDRKQLKAKKTPAFRSEQLNKQHHMQMPLKMNLTQIQRLKDSKLQPTEWDYPLPENPQVAKQGRIVIGEMELQPTTTKSFHISKRDIGRPVMRLHQSDKYKTRLLMDTEIGMKMPLPVEERSIHRTGSDINWSQTFQISHLNLQAHRSDRIDLGCNISGNLPLHSSGALPIVKAFMDQLNKKHHGEFTLVRVVNMVKRIDVVRGRRYLLELELKDVNGQLLRLSHYIFAPIGHRRQRGKDLPFQRQEPQLKLCNPVGFKWNPDATVHFIIPVKNQARWVQQLIADMEQLFRETGDTNFNVIITDYSSTDMDVRKALQESSLPRYQYVKLRGNFERAAGLQAGVNLINDDHSIVFLCDLHINFPPFIIDSIRKHCVKGYMAFAPIVMRLGCGVTRLEAKGFWEVNGFGLLGIYKSDLDAVGGMNTVEFGDSWGGEDWELIDRIIQGGLEVERLYLRNFFHHFHSKRGMWTQVSPSHS